MKGMLKVSHAIDVELVNFFFSITPQPRVESHTSLKYEPSSESLHISAK